MGIRSIATGLSLLGTFLFGSGAQAFNRCAAGCSPDHPARTLIYCRLNFNGFNGPVSADMGWVSKTQDCVQKGAQLVQKCVDQSSTPKMQAFHGDLYTAMIFARDGERIFWDFHVSREQSYDANGNLIVTISVDGANPSDTRLQPVQSRPDRLFYTVEIASLLDFEGARGLADRWERMGYQVVLNQVEVQDPQTWTSQVWTRVDVGSFSTEAQAQSYAGQLISRGLIPSAIIDVIQPN